MSLKPWKDLSTDYRRRLINKGITPRIRAQQASRKTWSQLSPGYQKRLKSAGITPAAHRRGESIQAARGHTFTPEHGTAGVGGTSAAVIAKAKRLDITTFVTNFNSLPIKQQRFLAINWILGFMSRGEGPSTGNKIDSKNPHSALSRKASDRQIMSRMAFMDWYEDNEGMDDFDYKEYRENYRESFSAAS